ncbi:MAG: sigma-54-dependent Fis family transcriptional regulator [Verrucomicrobia bacterium]|nr:sigma-54-dependent Fis family transcriptional regulator [Verrucomicrobiota bacterium]
MDTIAKNTDTTPAVLIADDEKHTREGLRRALEKDYTVTLAEDGTTAMRLLESEGYDLMLADLRMPGADGLQLVQRAQSLARPPVCIVMTAYGTVENAVEAMRRGAYDYLTKPIDLDRLELLLRRALKSRQSEAEVVRLRQQLDSRYGLENIIGQSAPMIEVLDTVRQVAPSRASVLIQGESGTGKEVVARAIHQISPRRNGPFVAVHCAALSLNLLESELFGHEKGAFTGAIERRIGRFEEADGGTIFLDEIGEIDPSVQVKILRVLGERQFERVGGNKTLAVDVRLVAATNRNLEELVKAGKFRDDLFYRLQVVTILLPALRERGDDVVLLANAFLREFARENNKPIAEITPDAMNALQLYPWPGNVRELRTAIERAVVLARGEKITLRDLPPAVRAVVETAREQGAVPPEQLVKSAMTMQEAERLMMINALKATEGNRSLAAKRLGISRRTLHRKIVEYKLHDL